MLDLVRKPLEEPLEESPAEIREDFALECNTRLGYSLAAATVKTHNEDAALRATLRELDIDPFEQESVTRYRRRKMDDCNRRRARLVGLNWGIFFAGCALLVASVPAGLAVGPAGFCPLAVAATTMIVAAVMLGTWILECIDVWEWGWAALEKFSAPVPEFALQSALEIRERCPEARFFVSYLVQMRDIAISGDPFLVVASSKGRRYYIEVWNEPSFAGRRMA